MDINTIERQCALILRLVSEKRLCEAFAALRPLASQSGNWEIMNRIDEAEQSYRYMVGYAAEGVHDPQRDGIYEGIMHSIRLLCAQTAYELKSQISTTLYYSTLRMLRMRPETLQQIVERIKKNESEARMALEVPGSKIEDANPMRHDREYAESSLFQWIWTMFPVVATDAAYIRDLIADTTLPSTTRELALTATMLNLLEHYNEELLLVLLDTYDSCPDLQIKAMCCALLVMYKYREIISTSHKIALRFDNFADNPQACTDITTIFLQFIRSRGTERIVQKVQSELVPKLMKLRPDLRGKLQGMEMPDETTINPDWQEMLDKSGITEKMEELSRMQAEGNDVFLSSFSRLKNFQFFNDIANWFRPFDPEYSEIAEFFPKGNNPLSSLLNHSGVFCDSDKYSFALSVKSVPPSQRSMMLGQFNEQNDHIEEMMQTDLPDPAKARENQANKFVQNLYRFFNLFARKAEFYNPFRTPMNLIAIRPLDKILSGEGRLRLIAEFYFHQEFYVEALPIFQKLAEKEPTAECLQKIGFCLEKSEQWANAVETYGKAELLKPDDPWTLQHTASCLRAQNKTEEALSYYRRIEQLQPENASIANTIGNCLLEAGKAADALKSFFKADYLAPKGNRSRRPIAWCAFLIGNFDQSLDYYDRITKESPTAEDWLNRGHVLLATGKIKDALASYTNAIHTEGYSIEALAKAFTNDKENLRKAGVDCEEIPLLLDKLRYDNQ